jgi:integrase
MRGVVDQRGDSRRRVRVFAGREDGRTRWVSRTVVGTKRQAHVALAKLVTEVETGLVAKSHPGSVADLLERWLDEIAPTRTAYTMREHRRSVERDIRPAIGALRLDKLSARDLDQLYRELLCATLPRRSHRIGHGCPDGERALGTRRPVGDASGVRPRNRGPGPRASGPARAHGPRAHERQRAA